MYCIHCGCKLPEGSSFCPSCGKAAAPAGGTTPVVPFPGIAPGFSEKINDPAIRAALNKGKGFTFVFGMVLVLAPILVTLFLSIKNDDFSNLRYGCFVSAVFLVFALFSTIKKKHEKQWDGVLIDKYTEQRTQSKRSDGDTSTTQETVYILKFRKDNGKTKKVEESEINHMYFDYLNAGDKVRYHPQFNYYFEKFDKSRDRYAICPICARKNDIADDVCRCGVPVIK